LVGIGGLAAAAWGSSRERRWQTREERATELRSVLEEGGKLLTQQFFELEEAKHEVKTAGKIDDQRATALGERNKRLVAVCNGVGMRRGSQAPEYLALKKCWEASGKLERLLYDFGEPAGGARWSEFSPVWKEALDAERAFFDATADALGWEGPLPRWRTALARITSWRA